ncbi:MAG TPA: enoyl-CoA hydratase/isomerase family protein [Chloroflexi bacterium]|nr:enoyl-CoA hydratase/isomerase family protein [Chloroflexota bacterium]
MQNKMEYEDLLLEKDDGGIAILTFNVPEKLNAITPKMGRHLPMAVDEVAQDDNVRVLIVTGAGRGFCSGADVSAMQSFSEAAEPSRFNRLQVTGWPFADVFPKLQKPTIAAINGPCVGGGLSLALSCDIRIASETAKFGVAQVARALVPDFGLTLYLPLAVGTSKALELMYTAELFDAAEAQRIGIVSQVVPPDDLMKTATELAAKIIRNPPLSVELTKQMVWRNLFDRLARQLDLETYSTQICRLSADHRESVKAFLEKRPSPRYEGK